MKYIDMSLQDKYDAMLRGLLWDVNVMGVHICDNLYMYGYIVDMPFSTDDKDGGSHLEKDELAGGQDPLEASTGNGQAGVNPGQSTPLGMLLGFTIAPTRCLVICDFLYINWPLLDPLMCVTFIDREVLQFPFTINYMEDLEDVEFVVVTVSSQRVLGKHTVHEWVADLARVVHNWVNARVYFATSLPVLGPRKMNVINFNCNLSNGIKVWNACNLHTHVWYADWHCPVLNMEPADLDEGAVYSSIVIMTARMELVRIIRL